MLDEVGLFDEDFFLYCEDTDLGLRARWAGWECAYASRAVVEHHYSHSAGRASALKAYYVERNRLFTLLKNFPARLLFGAPLVTLARYWWHAVFAVGRRGAAARFREEGNGIVALAIIVLRAHCALAGNARSLWRKRRAIRRTAKMRPSDFTELLRRQSISARQVARL
jgi:GT2 family glycosyltransferase